MCQCYLKKNNKPSTETFKQPNGKITQWYVIRKKAEKTELCSTALTTEREVHLPNPKFPQPTFFNTLFPRTRNQEKGHELVQTLSLSQTTIFAVHKPWSDRHNRVGVFFPCCKYICTHNYRRKYIVQTKSEGEKKSPFLSLNYESSSINGREDTRRSWQPKRSADPSPPALLCPAHPTPCAPPGRQSPDGPERAARPSLSFHPEPAPSPAPSRRLHHIWLRKNLALNPLNCPPSPAGLRRAREATSPRP